jgi:PhnB protein
MTFIVYLAFDGTCREAFEFYAKVLRGDITAMFPMEGAPDRVMHASLNTPEGGVLMGADAPTPHFTKPGGFCVNIPFTAEQYDEAERVFRELSEGGKVQMPLQETFWAKGFAMFIDRYGTPWMVNCG